MVIKKLGAEKLAQLLRTLAAFTEDMGSVHVQDIVHPCGYNTHLVHIYTHRQTLSSKHFIHIKILKYL